MRKWIVSVSPDAFAIADNANLDVLSIAVLSALDFARIHIEKRTTDPDIIHRVSRSLSASLLTLAEAGGVTDAVMAVAKLEAALTALDLGKIEQPAPFVRHQWLLWEKQARALVLRDTRLLDALRTAPDLELGDDDNGEASARPALGHGAGNGAAADAARWLPSLDDRPRHGSIRSRGAGEAHRAAAVSEPSVIAPVPSKLALLWQRLKHPFMRSSTLQARLLALAIDHTTNTRSIDR